MLSLKRLISEQRSCIMGVAILYIVMFHSELSYTGVTHIIKILGYLGVDIFLFISGFSIAYSLKKEGKITCFYMRRMRRILLPYFVAVVVQILLMRNHTLLSWQEIYRVFTFSGFWVGDSGFNWYVPAIMLFYFIAPIADRVFKENQYKLSALAIVLVIPLLLSVGFWGDFRLIAVSRLPIFLIGLYFGGMNEIIYKRKTVIGMSFLITIAGMLMLVILVLKCFDLMWDYGLWWYPLIVCTPSICVVIAWLFSSLTCMTKVGGVLCAALGKVGNASFEIYLTHVLLFKYVVPQVKCEHNNVFWYGMIILSIVIGMICQTVIGYITQKRKVSKAA